MKNKDFLTVAELADLEGVSRQRIHQLIRTYGVRTVRLGPRFIVIPILELKKIPSAEDRERLNGVSVDKR